MKACGYNTSIWSEYVGPVHRKEYFHLSNFQNPYSGMLLKGILIVQTLTHLSVHLSQKFTYWHHLLQLVPPWLRESFQGVHWRANQMKQCIEGTESFYPQQEDGLYLSHPGSLDKRVAVASWRWLNRHHSCVTQGKQTEFWTATMIVSLKLPHCRGLACRWCHFTFFQSVAVWHAHLQCVSTMLVKAVHCEKLMCAVSGFWFLL